MLAPDGLGIRAPSARLAACLCAFLAYCVVALLPVSARALPRFPSAETVPMPAVFPGNQYPDINAQPFNLRLVDLDGDGDLDVAVGVAVFDPSYLVTWFNQGDGSFKLGEATPFPAFVITYVETADVDLDGDVDVAVSNGRAGIVYLNDGKGKLTKVSANLPLEVFRLVDLNRDAFPDLIMVDSSNIPNSDHLPEPVVVYLNNRDGSFGLPPRPGTTARLPNVVMPLVQFAFAGAAPIVQDLNGDGYVDLVIEDIQGGRLLYYKGNGILSWSSRPTILPAGYSPRVPNTSDIDLDGDLDLVAIDDVYGALVVLENENGEFLPPVVAVSLTNWGSLSLADFNNDCFPDAVYNNGSRVGVMFNRGDGSFAEPIEYALGGVSVELEAGDVDGDGDLDLVASNGPGYEDGETSGFLTVVRNLGTGEFWVPRSYDVPTQTESLASGDFNGDHRADFAVGAGILWGSSTGGYEPFRLLDYTSSVTCTGCGAEVADLNADGLADLVQYRSDRTIRAYVSKGDGSFDKSWSVADRLGSVTLGRLNKDKLWDFVHQDGPFSSVEFWGASSTTFGQGPSVTWNFSNLSGVFLPRLADLNADGADELLVLGYGSNGLGVGVNNGDGTSFVKTHYALGATPTGLDVADFTGDGKQDAAVSAESGSVVIFPGKGDGSFTASREYPMARLPGRLASADFDADGDVDLIVSNAALAGYSVTYVENAGKGVLSNPQELLSAAFPAKVVTTDLEGDGDPDFAVINTSAETLTIFENRQLLEDPAKSHPAVCDLCPKDKNKAVPGVCGCGVADADTDKDGVLDCKDACPADATKVQVGNCGCGVSERDTDGDGKADCVDGCPQDSRKTVAGVCGCGAVDVDTDQDGAADCHDGCSSDAAKIAPGTCGCGVADSDSDGDRTLDCLDACPSDAAKTSPGACGCGARDDDADSDGTPDCSDGCPLDAHKIRAGACGCGNADTDTDGDGWPDCADECPSTPGTCASNGGGVGSGGAGGEEPSPGGAAGSAGAGPSEPEIGGAGFGGSEPSMGGGGGDMSPSAGAGVPDPPEAGGPSDSGGAPGQSFMRPTGVQILPKQPASGCDCSTASDSGASSFGVLPLSLLLLRQRRRAARKKPARRSR